MKKGIRLKDDAKPFALLVPRKVPMPLYDITTSEIKRMLKRGVIVPVDSAKEWCDLMVVTPKPIVKVRVCVDRTKLNEYVQREDHPLPPVDVTLGELAGAKYSTKLDANRGVVTVSTYCRMVLAQARTIFRNARKKC